MIDASLRKIEQELDVLATEASAEHPVDPHQIWIIARRIGAQAEMLEQGLGAP